MEAVLSTTDEEAMTSVAEGATRLLTKLVNPEMARQAITNDLIQPVIKLIHGSLKVLPANNDTQKWMMVQVQASTESLARALSVVRVIARFCDASHIPAMGEWVIHLIDPCLTIVHQRTASTPAQPLILNKWILIYQQILRKTFPQQNTAVTIFTRTIPLVVQALEQTQDPSTLKYIATAVEVFGGKTLEMDKSFQELLVHVTSAIVSKNNLIEAMELLQAYFECLQRFILFCPRGICYNPQLSDIVNIAVGIVSAIDSKDSTRAALVFLAQLFGWNTLRLSVPTTHIFQEAWNSLILKDLILRYGETLMLACFKGLSGGSQMLWPAYSDCVFAVVQAIALNEKERLETPKNPTDNISPLLNETLTRQWLFSSMTTTLSIDGNSSITKTMDTEITNQIIPIILSLARNGSKSRPKAKMLLTDYAKIRKGEMNVDSLISYSLP